MAQAQKPIMWHGVDRQVIIVTDQEQTAKHGAAPIGIERYCVQVTFTRYGYDNVAMQRAEKLIESFTISKNLSHKAACTMPDMVAQACDATYGQGFSYASGLKGEG